MFRILLFACVLLVVTTMPWKELTDEAFQETVVSLDDNGKLSWVEVEPPEDKDMLEFEIDPRMRIWKSMTDSGRNDQRFQMAEEDLDELHHPSVTDLEEVQNQGFIPVDEIQDEPTQEDVDMQHREEAEQDKDDRDHPDSSEVVFEEPEQDWEEAYTKAKEDLDVYLVPLAAEYRTDVDPRGVLYDPSVNGDDLLQQEDQLVQMEPLGSELESQTVVQVHLQPEEDLDDMYHKDLPFLQQGNPRPKPAGPVKLRSQMKYPEPEEDLDDLYHQQI